MSLKFSLKISILMILSPFLADSQIISQFSWDSNPVTTADVGPDATSVSGSATSDVGGVGGTNGLNAGLPKADINMIIPGSPTFDVPGIDVSIDSHREENSGDWFKRGNSLRLDGCNNISVTYRVDDGAGGFIEINSGNVFPIPNDDTYRNYRFYYLPSSGYGALLVDGVEVWSNDGPDNRDMYWTGAGDVIVGDGMDGTGNNDTFLDNLIVAEVSTSPLPIELLNFTATPKKSLAIQLYWSTASELNNDFFTVERSSDAQSWEVVDDVDGAGNSSVKLEYTLIDEEPYPGLSYYRLKQTDFDGAFSYSEIVSVVLDESDLNVYPNPADNSFTVKLDGVREDNVQLVNSKGQLVRVPKQLLNGSVVIDGSNLAPGIYFVNLILPGEIISKRIIIE